MTMTSDTPTPMSISAIPTPRTDAAKAIAAVPFEEQEKILIDEVVPADFARQLERELFDAKTSEREGWRYADELEQERKRLESGLSAANTKLLEQAAVIEQMREALAAGRAWLEDDEGRPFAETISIHDRLISKGELGYNEVFIDAVKKMAASLAIDSPSSALSSQGAGK